MDIGSPGWLELDNEGLGPLRVLKNVLFNELMHARITKDCIEGIPLYFFS